MLRDEHRLWVFQKRMMRAIFQPNKEELIGGGHKCHHDELRILYSCFTQKFMLLNLKIVIILFYFCVYLKRFFFQPGAYLICRNKDTKKVYLLYCGMSLRREFVFL
jgi:hypothetical protein